ncbi:hypothetical protein Rsub_08032 [Raphidocelis subcapitata]|uniref:mRNA export factor GLE1 n=1 Tax=Raphidocelis subcapitata TaxID=307507 RepID=A0A2V0PAG9_9CHLO|nr:hypothetical protein Rsub_08032 [Raphidocelis subcapitata]|eukprot:GBF94860.1 hypothetical protein Rsub_08032 [Raphidocelis subcapitata]
MWRGQVDGEVLSPQRQPVFDSPSPARRQCPGPAAPVPTGRPPQSPAGPSSSYGVPPDPAERLRQQRRQSGASAGTPQSDQPQRSRSVSFRVPDDDDSDSDAGGGGAGDDGGATSGLRGPPRSAAVTSSSGRRHPPDPVHTVHLARTRELKRQVQASFNATTAQLQVELHQIESDLRQELQRVAAEAEGKQTEWHQQHEQALAKLAAAKQRREEQLSLACDSAEQRQLLAEARRQREAQARAEAEARAAEALRQEEERRRQEDAAKCRAEEEAKAKAEAEARRAAAEAAAQQQQQEQRQQQQPGAASAAAPAPKPAAAASGAAAGDLKAAPGALEWERQMAEKLKAAEAVVADLMTKPELKAQRRMVEKRVTLIVSQIAGTQQQISDKVDDLLRLLASCPDEATKTLTCLTLATRMVSQCDSQVANCPTFAFPLAVVCVRVGSQVPLFVDLLVAKLHQACILTVPKYFTYRPGGAVSEADHFSRLGYALVDDAKRPGHKRLETTDEYAVRVAAHLHLYAALLGTPGGDARAPHPHPAANGWAWMARHLNALPATRVTAAALHAFLDHAGFALGATYRRQFAKLLSLVRGPWLQDLSARDDDAAAVATRIATYLDDRCFQRAPEGLSIKKTDVSSWWGQREEPGAGGGGGGRW